MAALDIRDTFQIRQRARHLENPVRGAQRQAHALAGALQPQPIAATEQAVLAQTIEIEKRIRAALPSVLPLACYSDFGGTPCTGVQRVWLAIQAGAFPSYRQMQINTIKQGAG